MKNVLSDLRKSAEVRLPNGGVLKREGKGAVYEATQAIRVPVALEQKAIDAVASDQPMLGLLQSLMGLEYETLAKHIAGLTPREYEVFSQMGRGIRNRLIAEDLGISTKTLDIHRANVGRKLDLRHANAIGRTYWFFRLCDHFYPEVLEKYKQMPRD